MPPSVSVPSDLPRQVNYALAEDLCSGDLTASLIPANRNGRASVITCELALICGIPYVEAVFHALDAQARIDWRVAEGNSAAASLHP